MIDLEKLKENTVAKKSDEEEEVVEPTEPVLKYKPVPVVKKRESKVFQHYKCSRSSMKLITTIGTPIVFVLYQFYTDNTEIIGYLDLQIKLGLKSVTKGEALTAEEADPMSRLRREIIAEYVAKEAAELAAAQEAAEAPVGGAGILSSSQVMTSGQSSSSDS